MANCLRDTWTCHSLSNIEVCANASSNISKHQPAGKRLKKSTLAASPLACYVFICTNLEQTRNTRPISRKDPKTKRTVPFTFRRLEGAFKGGLQGGLRGLHLCEAFKGLKGALRGLEKGFKGLEGGLRRASRGLQGGLRRA